jgi:hypothetical protein
VADNASAEIKAEHEALKDLGDETSLERLRVQQEARTQAHVDQLDEKAGTGLRDTARSRKTAVPAKAPAKS